ncbi:helix-turn-helix domain-containing protein [Gordonia sp. NPDC003376]
MSGNGGSVRLDMAIAAITQARNETEIAGLLVEYGATLSGANTAEVVQVGDEGARCLAHPLPCPDLHSRLGADDWSRLAGGAMAGPTAVASTAAAASGSARDVLCVPVPTLSGAPLLTDGPVLVGVSAFPGAVPRSALLLAGTLSREGVDEATLLAEVAAAAVDDLAARRSLRLHSENLHALGAELMTLADTGIDDDRGSLARLEHDDATTTADLTDREREILEVVVSGASNSQIAERFTISIETVKSHVKRILRKLNAANRSELIARYGGLGSTVTDPNPPPPRGPRPDRR